jgi:hypothetical protein
MPVFNDNRLEDGKVNRDDETFVRLLPKVVTVTRSDDGCSSFVQGTLSRECYNPGSAGLVMKETIGFVLALMLSFSGCRKTPEPTPEPKPQEKLKIQSFVPPTAEQAYRLQDDCTKRGEKVLRENIIGSALTEEQVSRYNATTNRCYVRLEVHAMNFDDIVKYDEST